MISGKHSVVAVSLVCMFIYDRCLGMSQLVVVALSAKRDMAIVIVVYLLSLFTAELQNREDMVAILKVIAVLDIVI